MDGATVIGLAVVSAAVAVAAAGAEALQEKQTCFELALCVAFHAGVALLIRGVRAAAGRRAEDGEP
ncbi:hypothetical protein ACP4OV_029406 [Aristida adscensionis]